MDLQKTMAALAGGKAAVVDAPKLRADNPSGRSVATDVDLQRQVALG